MSDTARLFAMAVDTVAYDRGSDLDAEERAAVLVTVDKRGELTICEACAGAGWASRGVLCVPCRGFGARP